MYTYNQFTKTKTHGNIEWEGEQESVTSSLSVSLSLFSPSFVHSSEALLRWQVVVNMALAHNYRHSATLFHVGQQWYCVHTHSLKHTHTQCRNTRQTCDEYSNNQTHLIIQTARRHETRALQPHWRVESGSFVPSPSNAVSIFIYIMNGSGQRFRLVMIHWHWHICFLVIGVVYAVLDAYCKFADNMRKKNAICVFAVDTLKQFDKHWNHATCHKTKSIKIRFLTELSFWLWLDNLNCHQMSLKSNCYPLSPTEIRIVSHHFSCIIYSHANSQ